jgi:hypothetical protein
MQEHWIIDSPWSVPTCRRCYINFIRRINSKRGSEGLDETKKAFDFMLNYVGKWRILIPNSVW